MACECRLCEHCFARETASKCPNFSFDLHERLSWQGIHPADALVVHQVTRSAAGAFPLIVVLHYVTAFVLSSALLRQRWLQQITGLLLRALLVWSLHAAVHATVLASWESGRVVWVTCYPTG